VFLLEKGLLLLSLLMPVESLMALDLRACVGKNLEKDEEMSISPGASTSSFPTEML
jgi:hypothetical protein